LAVETVLAPSLLFFAGFARINAFKKTGDLKYWFTNALIIIICWQIKFFFVLLPPFIKLSKQQKTCAA
jgi:hypothetical protein